MSFHGNKMGFDSVCKSFWEFKIHCLSYDKVSKYGQYLEPKAQPHVRLYLIAKICTFKWCPSAVVRHFT